MMAELWGSAGSTMARATAAGPVQGEALSSRETCDAQVSSCDYVVVSQVAECYTIKHSLFMNIFGNMVEHRFKLNQLRSVPVLRHFTDEELAYVAEHMETLELKEGEFLYQVRGGASEPVCSAVAAVEGDGDRGLMRGQGCAPHAKNNVAPQYELMH
jgi:hypothetical protein